MLYIFTTLSGRICAGVNYMYFVFPGDVNKKSSSGSNTTNIVAGVMVIGSLIAGLLFALLCFRKRKDKDTFNIHSNGNKGTTYIYSYFILYTHFSDYVCMRDFCETHAFYLLTYLVAKREVLSWLNLERTSLSRARIGEFLCYLKTSNSRDSLPYHDLLNVFRHNMTALSYVFSVSETAMSGVFASL